LDGSVGGGFNGGFVLYASTITDDGVANVVQGGSGLDWFLIGAQDQLSGFDPKKEVETLI
jgi:hypothetical protein